MLKYPISAFLEITESCNLNCLHCYNNSGTRKYDTDKNKLIRLIDDIANNNAIALSISGGEPLLHNNFFEILEHINTNTSLKVAINSNGLLVNEEVITNLLKYGVTDIQISIDGDEETHDYIRGKGTYNKTFENIKKCITGGIRVKIGVTVNNLNYDKLDSITESLKTIGVTSVCFYRYIPTSKRDLDSILELHAENLKKAAENVIRLPRKFQDGGFQIYFEKLSFFAFLLEPSLINQSKCLAGLAQLNVDSDLNVSLCSHLKNKSGNLKGKTIKEVWKIQNQLKEQLYHIPIECKECEYNKVCKGGCKSFSYNKYNRFDIKDEGCFKHLI